MTNLPTKDSWAVQMKRERDEARRQRDIAVKALRDLIGWSKLARVLDPSIAASIDGDFAWTQAREVIEGTEGTSDES